MSSTTWTSQESAIAKSLVQYLAAEYSAGVTITLEIWATFPNGAPEQVVRTVTEKARTLGVRAGGERRLEPCAVFPSWVNHLEICKTLMHLPERSNRDKRNVL